MAMSMDLFDDDAISEVNFDDVDDKGGEQLEATQLGKSEKDVWLKQSLDEKCRDVMNLLVKRERRWDTKSGNSDIKPLEDYKIQAMTGRDDREKTTPTVLHILAKADKKVIKDVPSDILALVVKYLLEHRDKSASSQAGRADDGEEPILKVAMDFDNSVFIQCVMECWAEGFPDLLDSKDSQGMNCLHYIFKKNKRFKKLVTKARPETLATKDTEGNTPIHYAMDYRLCRERQQNYDKLVQLMVLRGDTAIRKSGEFNQQQESPYLYYQRTRAECMKANAPAMAVTKSHPAVKTSVDDGEQNGKLREMTATRGGRIVPERAECSVPPKPTKLPASNTHGTGSLLDDIPVVLNTNKALTAPKGAAANTERVVSAPDGFGLRRSPTANINPPIPISGSPLEPAGQIETQGQTQAIHAKALVQSRTPFPTQSRKKQTDPTDGRDGSREDAGDVNAEKIREFLRLHYIRTRSDLEARSLIYGRVASGKRLDIIIGHCRSLILTIRESLGFGNVPPKVIQDPPFPKPRLSRMVVST
jgi:hypothetical protein